MVIILEILALFLLLIGAVYFLKMYRKTGVIINLAYCIGAIAAFLNFTCMIIFR